MHGLLFTAFTYACTFLSLYNEVRLISLVLWQFLFLITWLIDWVARLNFSIRQTAFTAFTKLVNHACEHTASLVNMWFMSCTSHFCTGICAKLQGILLPSAPL